MQEKKKNYRRLAQTLVDHKKMEDYLLKIDKDKQLLVFIEN